MRWLFTLKIELTMPDAFRTELGAHAITMTDTRGRSWSATTFGGSDDGKTQRISAEFDVAEARSSPSCTSATSTWM